LPQKGLSFIKEGEKGKNGKGNGEKCPLSHQGRKKKMINLFLKDTGKKPEGPSRNLIGGGKGDPPKKKKKRKQTKGHQKKRGGKGERLASPARKPPFVVEEKKKVSKGGGKRGEKKRSSVRFSRRVDFNREKGKGWVGEKQVKGGGTGGGKKKRT